MNEQSSGPSKRASDAAVAVVRQLHDAFNAQEIQAAADLFSDDVEWHEIGRAEPIRGKAAMAERFAGGLPKWKISSDVHDMFASEEHVVSLVNATAEMGGDSFTYKTAEIFHVRDGKITARWAFSDDTDRINKFFAGT